MPLTVKTIENKDIWEDFLLRCKEKTFLNSWNWGEFNKAMGYKIWRLGLYENPSQLIGAALVIKIKARRGTFLFVPHGPSLGPFLTESGPYKESVLCSLLAWLKQIARTEKADFIRISPIWQRTDNNKKLFQGLGFRDSPLHIHPDLTWELDITHPEDVLLAGMRKTTRYLIKQAQKNQDVEIVKSQSIADIEKFNWLYRQTARKHKFMPFSLDYLRKEFAAFSADNEAVIFLGKYKGEIVASAVIIYWQGVGFYHQGASSFKYPKIPLSYLVQWEAIKEAKKRNCGLYNFWGVAPTDNSSHPWAGLTLFKKGFGGYLKEYLKTQDLPLTKKYWLNFFVEKVRKMKRGL